MEFEIRQIMGKQMKPTGRFEVVIKGDQYWKARALIYDEFIAEELAKQLKIKVLKHKENNESQRRRKTRNVTSSINRIGL